MRKSVAILCNTSYQLLVALQMKLTVLKKMDVDLFISDWFVDARKCVKSGQKLKLFRDIRYIETLDYSKRRGKYQQGGICKELKYTIERYQEVKKIVGKIESYDYYFCACMTDFECAFYDVLKQESSNLKLYIFDDGLSTYNTMGLWIKYRWKSIVKGKYAGIYKLTKYGQALKSVRGVFIFNPQFCDWENMRFYKIPKISLDDVETIAKVNILFDYDDKKFDNNAVQAKVIYFEDALYEDGCKVNDVRLVDSIANCIGKENILVKTHPRSREDRFLGYSKISNTIPWEVFYLNNNWGNAKLVTILSSAVFQPFLLFDDEREVVLLWDVSRGDFKKRMEPEVVFIKESIVLPHSDIYRLIKDKNDLQDYFHNCAIELNS